MKNGAKLKTICLAALTVAMSALMIVTATYALFSDTKTVNNHLSAGTLKIGLTRVSLTGKTVDERGMLADFTREENVDLTTDGSKIFDLTNVVPGITQTAVIAVENKGTTAFDYAVKIVSLTAEGSAAQALCAQLRVDVKTGETIKKSFMLDKWEDADNVVSLGSILLGGAVQQFSVTVTFVDGQTNNAAQDARVEFDLQVSAIQKVA